MKALCLNPWPLGRGEPCELERGHPSPHESTSGTWPVRCGALHPIYGFCVLEYKHIGLHEASEDGHLFGNAVCL